MRRQIAYICILLLFNCGFSKNFITKPVKKVISNHKVQVYGGMVAYGLFAYQNASADASWFTDKPYGIDKNKWHYYKNSALFWLIVKAGLSGLEIGQDHATLWQVVKRTGYESLIVWDVWQLRKHYIVSGNALDFREGYNQHLFVLPTPFGDKYIGLRDWQVPTVYVGFAGIGIWGLAK